MSHQKTLFLHSSDKVNDVSSWESSLFFLRCGICVMLIGAFAFLTFQNLVAPEQPFRGIGAVLLILLGVIAWFFQARGDVRQAVHLMVGGLWLIITVVSVFCGGVRTPLIAAYPLVILSAGWLMSPRAAWLAAGASLFVTVSVLLAEMQGILPMPAMPLPSMYGLIQILIILLSALMVTVLVRAYYNRLIELQKTSDELTQLTLDLKKRKAELHRAQAVANVGSWRFNLGSNAIQLSAETCRILCLPEQTAGSFSSYMRRVYRTDYALVVQQWQAALKGGVFDHEHRIVSGQQVRWVRQKAEFEYAPDGTAVSALGTIEDITDRKKNEAELVAARSEAEAANHAKSRFLAAASHDLRQPIAALSLYVSALKRHVPPDELTLVDHIQECVSSLNVLLTDLLDVSKLDAGAVRPTLSDFSIDDMLASLISVHAVEANIKGLRLQLRRSNINVCTDQQLMRRMLGNLIVNALHYTESGGVLVACRRHEGKCWIEIWDSGPGIPPDKTGIIFEEFRQLGDNARNRGSGLGLAIVAKSAALLGLQIRLRSRVGRGSMFAIEVPQGRSNGAVEHLRFHAQSERARIAIVEDNAQLRGALALVMEAEGHEVVAAASGHALMEQLAQGAPDLLISDYRLADGQTGFDAIAMVRRAFGNELPAIIITGDTDPALVRSMADRGIAVHYKPLKMEMLQAFIRETMERRQV